MNWVEYKLENDSVIKVPYNRCNVAPVTKEVLEQLIKVVNASMRQAKILEHIKTNYADRMREQYEQGRVDAIEECIKVICGNIKSIVGIYNKDTPLIDRASYRVAKNELIEELVKQLKQLKEQK